MTAKPPVKKARHPARPIRTKRDHEGAAAAAKRLADQAVLDAAAEERLQSLLHELDKFDEPEVDSPESPDENYGDPRHVRRWSDGSAEDS